MQNSSVPIEILLKQNEDNFSKKEKIIVKYILDNLNDLEKLDGKTITKECNVGFSTLYNLFKKINIKSMKDFLTKVNLEIISKKLINDNSFSSMQKVYMDILTKNNQLITKETLYNFIDYIIEANLIYIIGAGESHLAAIELSRRLNKIGFQSFVIGVETSQIVNRASFMKEKDLLISISMSGKTESVINTTKIAKENGANVVIITEKTNSSLEKFADFKIHLFASNLQQQNQNISISPLTSFGFFTDSLINEISNIDFNKYYNLKIKIAIDIGGTNTRVAAISSNNKILDLSIFNTNKDNFLLTYKKICEFINKFKNINLISVCLPGAIDFENGKLIHAINLKSWDNLAIKDIFKKDYPRAEIKLMNDARAAALGQYEQFKDLPHAKVLFYTTISTGIGAGLVINGEIFEGINKLAGEVGSTMIEHQDQDSLNPLHGIEYYCSGLGIMQNYPYNHCQNIQELFKSHIQEDKAYLEVINAKLASYFATAIGFYNPGLIIVGGSVAENNQDFMIQVFDKTKKLITKTAREKIEFKIAKNTLESTLIGLVA